MSQQEQKQNASNKREVYPGNVSVQRLTSAVACTASLPRGERVSHLVKQSLRSDTFIVGICHYHIATLT